MAKRVHEEAKIEQTQLIIFRLRDEEFGAEISSVLEISRILEITRLPEAPGFIEGVVNLRGQVVPIVDLAKQFGLAPEPELPKTARIVVVEAGEETVGLVVDEVPEVLRVALNDIEPTPELVQSAAKQDYIQGVAKLGTRLVIILNLNKVLAPHEIEAVGKITESSQ